MDGEALITLFKNSRKDSDLVVIEGLHALKHAFRFNAKVSHIYTNDLAKTMNLSDSIASDLIENIQKIIQEIPEKVFKELLLHTIPTGVIAIAKKPKIKIEQNTGRLIYLDNPHDVWNVGAVVRVAAAAGSAGVVTNGKTDPWHSACLVASAGLHFAIPVAHTDKEPSEFGTSVIVLDPEGTEKMDKIPKDCVLVFGSERTGVSQEIKDTADMLVKIPMKEKVSSLNLSTAVAATLYYHASL